MDVLSLTSAIMAGGEQISGYDIFIKILTLLAGLGVFLYGIKVMGDNLEIVAGDKMRTIFNKISGNRFTGVLTGAGVTCVIQSSSATTVMVVGFVNAGLMTLFQAASIIMGANIGTTITAQIAALKSLQIDVYFMVLACIGAFMMMSKKDLINKIGAICAGLGMIFVGLDFMSSSMKFVSQIDAVKEIFASKVAQFPLLLVLIGLVFTAIIQSSSAATGILISMAGLLDLQQIMFATLGVNIGTCVTALIASIGTTTNAKRASLIHILFNVTGALIFLPIIWGTSGLGEWSFAGIFDKIFPDILNADGSIARDLLPTRIAMFHTFFNVACTLIMLPFIKQLVWVAEHIIPEKKKKPEDQEVFVENNLKYIDKRILSTPPVAINQVKQEILLMSQVAKKNFALAIQSVIEGKPVNPEKFDAREKHLNFLNREIPKFIIELTVKDLSFKDEVMLASYYRVISDLERVGDYAENITEYAAQLHNFKSTFSEQAIGELKNMIDNINKVFDYSINAFEHLDYDSIETACNYEDIVDKLKLELDLNHIKRLNNNQCSAETGAVYLSLVSNLERISDHMQNVALSIKDYTPKPKKVYAVIK